MRVVSTRVLPEPAPASINAWLAGRVTAASCSGLRFCRRGDAGATSENIAHCRKLWRVIGSNFPDSDEVVIPAIVLTKEWRKYTIDLAKADLSAISGGFCWMANVDMNPYGMTFYLDDIRYEFNTFGD